MTSVKMVFIRHSFACHNILGQMYKNGTIDYDVYKGFMPNSLEENVKGNKRQKGLKPIKDPELTTIGVTASINNGCVVKNILFDNFNVKRIDVVCCSPLIRCMETAYYFTRKWSNPPKLIYVMPYLREIDERSDDIYSEKSLEKIRTAPAYSIKSISEQKAYLKSVGILEYFDFSYVEKFSESRLEPGNIKKFIDFFGEISQDSNVLVISHAGVLKAYANEGFTNNSGFVLDVKFENKVSSIIDYTSLNPLITQTPFFFDYNKYSTVSYLCPDSRCNDICDYIQNKPKIISKIPDVKCKDLSRDSSIDSENVSDTESGSESESESDFDDTDDVWSN